MAFNRCCSTDLHLKDLWENYHHYVEIFYDYIKINKELRDLDLKKNLEAKVFYVKKLKNFFWSQIR